MSELVSTLGGLLGEFTDANVFVEMADAQPGGVRIAVIETVPNAGYSSVLVLKLRTKKMAEAGSVWWPSFVCSHAAVSGREIIFSCMEGTVRFHLDETAPVVHQSIEMSAAELFRLTDDPQVTDAAIWAALDAAAATWPSMQLHIDG